MFFFLLLLAHLSYTSIFVFKNFFRNNRILWLQWKITYLCNFFYMWHYNARCAHMLCFTHMLHNSNLLYKFYKTVYCRTRGFKSRGITVTSATKHLIKRVWYSIFLLCSVSFMKISVWTKFHFTWGIFCLWCLDWYFCSDCYCLQNDVTFVTYKTLDIQTPLAKIVWYCQYNKNKYLNSFN
jgi:hypothetical protein